MITTGGKNGEPLRILLADDSETDRKLFIEAFRDIGLNTIVATVNDGEELMEYLHNKQASLPHLLFLDLNMPRKSGLECLREIKANPAYNDVSIAIYSTSASEKDIEETFMNGANVYIKKPVEFDMLIAVLKKAVTSAYNYQSPPFNKANFLLRI